MQSIFIDGGLFKVVKKATSAAVKAAVAEYAEETGETPRKWAAVDKNGTTTKKGDCDECEN